ncbi:class I SAM-dependent methyltransferase [Heyndrickxia ginsengihumi]|uniref:class I SAM-dependent methyltransferase n=1 Tax=Heyndrickxia ginsengihumi TaxID=363870 RepID=UPI000471B620|nr:class I SAM-dependent methyltransferase [Heyndrickxia ginsengihumi]MBE6182750.1 class I SAM-dependent methyltransferase [Bacillus sp. (in: firmicutes)]MCM3021937.1 class I SAM-dependent methyltransferase [Heyndrickxia ginsengihumi]
MVLNKIQLDNEKETLLITLYAKALDSRSKNSILKDKKAAELVDMIDYNFEKLHSFGNETMVVRAKQLDSWLHTFLENHQDATVLNLGCGLDTRISRVHPPSTVKWFDVDYPEVIEVRKHFYSNCEGYQMIASSVTELNWLEKIPKDKPAIIIAEGLLEYLTKDEVKILLERLTKHFPSGQIAFDVMNSFAINAGKEHLKKTTGAEHKWAVDDIHEVDKLNAKLKRIASFSIFRSKYIHKLPFKLRFLYTIMYVVPNFRNMIRLLLYKF